MLVMLVDGCGETGYNFAKAVTRFGSYLAILESEARDRYTHRKADGGGCEKEKKHGNLVCELV